VQRFQLGHNAGDGSAAGQAVEQDPAGGGGILGCGLFPGSHTPTVAARLLGKVCGQLLFVLRSQTRPPRVVRSGWATLDSSPGYRLSRACGGVYGFIVVNIWPMNPSGVQLISPIVPRPADTGHLAGAGLVVRGEHDPDAGKHRVELAVGKGECLGISLPPLQHGGFLCGLLPPELQKFRCQVARHDLRAGQCCGNGGVARPAAMSSTLSQA
jgi:hypothetical protein